MSHIGTQQPYSAEKSVTANGRIPDIVSALESTHSRSPENTTSAARRHPSVMRYTNTPVAAQEGARLPGEGRAARRAKVVEQGLEIAEDRLANLKALAEVI